MAVTALLAGSAGSPPGGAMGPADLLRLAILGAAVRGPAEPEGLIGSVQALGGRFWRPTAEVVIAGVEALAGGGYLVIAGCGGPCGAAVIRSTDAGVAELARLMRLDAAGTPDPLFHSVLGVKVALLDLLPPPERWRQIDRLVERLNDDRAGLRAAPGTARQFEEHRLDGEIRWLADLRDRAAARIGRAAGISPDAA